MGGFVKLCDLVLGYNRHPAVHHLSGQFDQGSLTALAGPNGAGKSSLLKAIVGLMPVQEGHIHLQNCAKCDIAYLPQADKIDSDIPLTLFDFLQTALWPRGHKHAANMDAERALAEVGLKGFGHRTLEALSTGQFRRLLFARLMMMDSPLILLDEPFAGVDAETTARLLHIIKNWHAEGRTILCVLHDFEMIRRHFPTCLLLAREAIGWGKPDEVLTEQNLTRAYSFDGNWDDAALVCAR